MFGTGCLARYHWLRLWQQHRLARGALLVNHWLRLWRQQRLARSASRVTISCAYGGSIDWAQDASLDINSCAYDSSNIWHGMPCSLSLAVITPAALLGTWYLARYCWLRLRPQHCLTHVPRLISLAALAAAALLGHDASFDTDGRANGSSNAWHVLSCSLSLAALTAAALIGTGCLVRCHWLRKRRQYCLALCLSRYQ